MRDSKVKRGTLSGTAHLSFAVVAELRPPGNFGHNMNGHIRPPSQRTLIEASRSSRADPSQIQGSASRPGRAGLAVVPMEVEYGLLGVRACRESVGAEAHGRPSAAYPLRRIGHIASTTVRSSSSSGWCNPVAKQRRRTTRRAAMRIAIVNRLKHVHGHLLAGATARTARGMPHHLGVHPAPYRPSRRTRPAARPFRDDPASLMPPPSRRPRSRSRGSHRETARA